MKSPIQLYSGVLNSIGCVIDSQGFISQSIVGSQPIPVDIDGRRLVLPTPEVLSGLDNSKMIAFHPICENITMGNSPVIEKFRRMVQTSISTRFASLAIDLLSAIVDTPDDRQLTGSILGLAEHIPDANKKTLTALEKVLQTLNGDDRTVVRIYLKRQAELNGVKYRREAAVHFPLMDEFADNKPSDYVYDVKMSKRDKNTLRILFNILIPNIEKPNAYSVGSNSTVAPSFDALLRVTHKLCGEIGSRAYQYRKNLDIVLYRTDITWGDEDLNLSEYANFIPNLDGNDGTIAANQQGGTTVNVPTQPTPAFAGSTPAAIGAANMNMGYATSQNPGVAQPTAPPQPTQAPFRGLGTAPPATGGMNGMQTGARTAQPQITNPSIYANPAPMLQQGMMPGMMPGMGMPGMMPGMGMAMPGMMPMPGMGMPGMMPGMGGMPMMQQPMMGMQQPMMMQAGVGQAPFPAVGQQPMQQQMVPQQMPGMMYPGMQMQQGMQPMGYQQPQVGGGLFKRA